MVSDYTLKIIENNCRKSFAPILPKKFDFSEMASEFVSVDRAREELQRLSERLPDGLSGKKLLELGSGYGMLVAIACKEFSADAFGVEPSDQFKGTFSTSMLVLREMGIQDHLIKFIPF